MKTTKYSIKKILSDFIKKQKEEKAQFCMDNPIKSPAFQFYPDSWFGSRHVSAMSIEERGIHATLIFAAWLENNCGIPENEICISARITEEKKTSALKVIDMCWFLYSNFYYNEKLLNVRIERILLSGIRREVGCSGGRPVKSMGRRLKPIGNQMDSKQKPNDNQTRDKDIDKDIDKSYRECSLVLRSRILEKRKAVIDDLKLLKWDNTVRLMVERDKYSTRDIIDTINACHDMAPRNGFTWADNILSMDTLRIRMKEGKIYPGMNSNNNKTKKITPEPKPVVTPVEDRASPEELREIRKNINAISDKFSI